MGLLCCKLLQLFCCPPWIPSIVSKLAFNPPICSYYSIKDSQENEKIVLNNDPYGFVSEYERYIEYHGIRTNPKKVLACIYIRTARWTKDTILLSHGNAIDIGMILESLIDMGLKLKVNIISYDYSGYGLSSGFPSESNLYSDIMTVFDYTRQRLDIPLKNIIVYGQSIGSVPSTYLATRFKVGLVVLHSPIASGCRLIPNCCCAQSCCDVLNNSSMAPKIKSPTLIIHGIDDTVIPIDHSYHILRSVPPELVLEPLFISGANHNDCEMYPEYLYRLISVISEDLPRFQNNFSDSVYLS